MKIAVVILNYNGLQHLKTFFPAVVQYSEKIAEVLVADNCSEDDSVNWLRQHYPAIEVIQLTKNFGFADGYNQALKQVDADYYILINSDVEVGPDWLTPIIQHMEANPQIAAAQPKIKAFTAKDQFEYAGAAGGWIDYLGYPFCRGRVFDVNEEDQGQYDQPQAIFWASGAALFIRAPLFHQIGGFDPSYFAHSEEIDLCWRLQRAGYKIMCFPETTVYHLGGGTLNYQSAFKTFLNFRNSLFTLLKNEPAGKLIWLIFARLILDGIAGLLFISQGKFNHLGAILKAHWSFYANFRTCLSARKKFNHRISDLKSKNSDPVNFHGRYFGSIVFRYYVLRIKYFKGIR